MKVYSPTYYHLFNCIAGSCPDSCCKDWEVQVDPDTAKRYRELPGPLGDRLRQAMRFEEDGSAVMVNENGRCPMWRNDGLCRIHAELGEPSLCDVCMNFPRLNHDYGTFMELGLELSCPEATKFILSDQEFQLNWMSLPGDHTPDYDTDAMDILLRTREEATALLRDQNRSVPEALSLLLLYGYQAQAELDGEEAVPFDPDAALQTAADFASGGSLDAIVEFFGGLEILTPDWNQMLSAAQSGPWLPEHRAMAGYMVRRYWLQAVSDYDLACRVKFIIISCLLVRHLGGNVYRTAQLFSKETENNIDNVDAILDAAYSHPAFTDAALLDLLRG